MAETGTADTFPRLLQWHARQRPDATAIREKDLGIWQSWTWAEALREVQHDRRGASAGGFQRGEHLAIIGDNRPRLYSAMFAAQCLGGIPVPLYQDAVAAEMAFVFQNAEIRSRSSRTRSRSTSCSRSARPCPQLKHIIYEDPRGLRHYEQAGLACYEQLRALGEQLLNAASGIPRGRDREGPRRRVGGDVLHLGHDRQCQRAWCSHASLIDRPRRRPRWSA